MKQSGPHKLNRREVLRAAGVSLSLPLFDSFFSDRSLAAGIGQPRFIALYKPNRNAVGSYRVTDLASLPTVLRPLESIKGEVTFIQGLRGSVSEPYPDGHAPRISTFLTGGVMTHSTSVVSVQSPSIDQLIANARGTKALTLARDAEFGAAGGFHGDYFDCLSWRSPLPDAKLKTPRVVFETLFGATSPTGPTAPSTATINRVYKKSILDFVKEQLNAKTNSLGKSDKLKMDQYLTGVRDLEVAIAKEETGSGGGTGGNQCSAPAAPADSSNFITNTQLMIDLIVKAVECGKHDAMTFMMDFEVGNGYRSHHSISHDGPESTMVEIDTWYVQQFANLITKLNAIPEGTGTLLSNSLVLYGSGSGEGGANYHGTQNLPILLAGRASGKVTPGRILTKSGITHCNLLLTIAQMFNLNLSKIGNSTGAFTDLA